MSERATYSLHILTFLTLSLSFQSSLSYNTAILDVDAAIQKTLDILSFKPQQEEEPLSESTLSSPYLSLSIFPRSSIFDSHSKDYESLVISRLARDAARVNSILARVDSLSAPVISGVSEGSGEYFARIGIGRPIKNYYWIVDTGSDVSWLQCLPCYSCYRQSDPIFDPSASSSYRTLSCQTLQCQSLNTPTCVSDSCQYQVSYGDGSSTYGDYISETLAFSSSASVGNLSVGCGHDNKGGFVGAPGLIGLGGGDPSLSSQLKAKSFSYCLVDRDSTGSSTLDFDSGPLTSPVTTTLVRNMRYVTYRYIRVVDMSVGGRRLRIPSSVFEVDFNGRGGTIIDSGTTVTRLKTTAYVALRNEFVRQARNLKRTTGYQGIFDTCFYLSSGRTAIPTVSFNFPGDQALVLPANNILVPVDSRGKFCFAFAATDSFSIIGNVQQQTIRVNFDLVNRVIQFSPKQC